MPSPISLPIPWVQKSEIHLYTLPHSTAPPQSSDTEVK
jgi:hypothetical protein